jgi:hypothetical protein
MEPRRAERIAGRHQERRATIPAGAVRQHQSRAGKAMRGTIRPVQEAVDAFGLKRNRRCHVETCGCMTQCASFETAPSS